MMRKHELTFFDVPTWAEPARGPDQSIPPDGIVGVMRSSIVKRVSKLGSKSHPM